MVIMTSLGKLPVNEQHQNSWCLPLISISNTVVEDSKEGKYVNRCREHNAVS